MNKIALSSNDNRGIESTGTVETYAYGRNKNLGCKKEEIKCNNIIQKWTIQKYNTTQNNTKILNFDYIKKRDMKEHNPN